MKRAILPIAALALMAAAPAEKIAGEELSWGRVQRAWSIDINGVAHFSERQGTDFHNYYLVTRRRQLGLDEYNTIARLVAPLREKVGVELKCEPGPTDGPYGMVTWTEAGTPVRYDFNSSCVSLQTSFAFTWNQLARNKIRGWTLDGDVIERKWMGAPGQEPK